MFVTDLSHNDELRDILDTLSINHPTSLHIKPLYDKKHPTNSLVRIYIYGDIKLPPYTEYIPFNTIIFGNYDQNRQDLDLRIISELIHITVHSVTQTHTNNSIMLEFFINAEPLYIDPYKWSYISKSLAITEGMKLVSSNPLMNILLYENNYDKIVKHPNCNIWMCPVNYDISHIESKLESIIDRGIFSVDSQNISIKKEICKSYDYKYYNIQDSHNIYLIGKYPFDKDFFIYAFDEIINGNIPYVSVNFPADDYSVYQWKATFTNCYINTIKNYSYCNPQTIDSLDIINNDDILTLSFMDLTVQQFD